MKLLSFHLAEYLQWRQSLKLSKETVQGDQYKTGAFITWLYETYHVETPDRLKKEYLYSWQKYIAGLFNREGRPQRAESINNKIVSVKGFLRYLAKNDYIRSNLLEVLMPVKVPKLLPGNVLKHAQIKKMLAKISTDSSEGYRNRTMLELLYSTGVRTSEIINLDIGDIDHRNKTIMVMGKGSKERVVPVGKTAMRYLESYITAVRAYSLVDRSEKAVFLNRDGKRVAAKVLRVALHEATRNAGVELTVTPHTFRRSCATELIRGGANMYHVKELLGHESLDTLKHYAKLTITDLKKTHEKCHPRERD